MEFKHFWEKLSLDVIYFNFNILVSWLVGLPTKM